jgi:hypothetical protein
MTEQLDLNDIRAALGAIVNNTRDLNERLESVAERLDDLGVFLARSAEFSEFLNDVEGFIRSSLPAQLRKVGEDPMIGMFAGPHAGALADQLEAFFAERAQRRASPPAIEQMVKPETL